MATIPDHIVKSFNQGTITRIQDDAPLPKGAASDSQNWLSKGDRIELRGGQVLMGTEVSGNGRITGLKVGMRADGTQVPFWSHTRKVKYYDSATADWIEVGSNIIGTDASGEDFVFDQYSAISGYFIFGGGPNTTTFKIPVANPGSSVDQVITTFRGYPRIRKNRTWLVNRQDSATGADSTGVYGSYIDKDELSDFTQITAEVLGASGSTTYTGALAAKAAGAKRTCMYPVITGTTGAGVETFQEDRNGVLTGNLGGTGTINYATMAYSVTFNGVVTGGNVEASYYWEDSTSTGILDFSHSGTRTAGQGFRFAQNEGGNVQAIGSIGSSDYVFHQNKTYKIDLTLDDTNATNETFRGRLGIPYHRAMKETGDGILYMDTLDLNEPAFRILKPGDFSTDVKPQSLSDQLDLTPYEFDTAFVGQWGIYDFFFCRTKNSTVNDTLFMRHRKWGIWDRIKVRGAVQDEYNGTFLVGDSAGNNVYTLFSGYADEDSVIDNYWISGEDLLGVEGIKQANLLVVGGQIARDQAIKVSASLDGGAFVELRSATDITDGKHAIDGRGSYVNSGGQVLIGNPTIGSTEIG